MTVWILLIDHRHGRDMFVFDDQEKAHDALAAYCRAWWEDEIGDEAAPEDDGEIISQYFAVMNERDEFYEIDQCDMKRGA